MREDVSIDAVWGDGYRPSSERSIVLLGDVRPVLTASAHFSRALQRRTITPRSHRPVMNHESPHQLELSERDCLFAPSRTEIKN